MNRDGIVAFNKKLFKAFQVRGITIGAVPDLEQRLISDYLIEQGLAEPALVNSVLEEITGVQALDPSFVSFDPVFIEHITLLLPSVVAREETVFPVKHENDFVHVVMAMPQDETSLRHLEAVTGSRIRPYCSNGTAIRSAIERYYAGRTDIAEPMEEKAERLTELALQSLNRLKTSRAEPLALINDAHLVRLLQYVMNSLVKSGASDLHMEPREHDFRIRFRKDGVMQTAFTWPPVFKDAIIPRLKMIARMDMNERSLPQDGSINFGLIKNRVVDIRVSSLPALYGEKIVMRILERDKKQLTFKNLGLETRDERLLEDTIRHPTGLLLVTGPTGSGKSSTLYAVLNQLNADTVNIVTAEDPVEYKLNGLTQVSCSADNGLTFNEALRSFLRQDPDIIMVGEIRDAETADIALKAAMTGHLVLSTLHTNDAAGAINRLVNMGIPPYLVASAQVTVIAQRLMRRLCETCKQASEPEIEVMKVLGIKPGETGIFKAVGCPECSGTGYNGRMGIYELLQVNDRIVDLILKDQPARVLKAAAVEDGMTTLRDAALHKLAAGVTTIEEVLRVTMES
ncbi:MAG: type II secretion system protein GspE [Desulfobacteraceae bacterium]|nr:MAG: type II secretion system protein GspE [Desulfobacteraceae bacterium]